MCILNSEEIVIKYVSLIHGVTHHQLEASVSSSVWFSMPAQRR